MVEQSTPNALVWVRFLHRPQNMIDNRVLAMRSGDMHVRRGFRWNAFEKEILEKMQKGQVMFVDIVEGVELFVNIYFGLLARS